MKIHPDIERIASLGWRVAPVSANRVGKFRGYIDAATADLETIADWSHAYPGCNWIVVPDGSGVWALDVDVPGDNHAADGVAMMRDLVAANGPIPPRPHGRSGGGGHLLVFRDAGHPVRTKSGTPYPGIDPKAGRCSFTVSPSRHRNGGPYSWTVAPWDIAPPVAPDWLLKAVAPPPEPPMPALPPVSSTDLAMQALNKAVWKILHSGSGSRNDTLNAQAYLLARHVGAGSLSEREAIDNLSMAAQHAGLDRAEIRSTLKSAFRTGLANPLARFR